MSPTHTQANRRAPWARPAALLSLALVCLLSAVVGGAALAGYRAGVSQREGQRRATQVVELQLQFDLGTTDLAAGRYEVAAERFAYVLTLDPDYPQAAANLATARAALRMTPVPSQTPIPTPASQDPAVLLALARERLAAGEWDAVIAHLADLRALDPAYEIVQADGLLFTALRNRGVARIQAKELEAGIFDLDQAGAFGPLDTEALNYRAWARLYLNAVSHWGFNWELTVENLELLFVLAPNFHDTSARYREALRQSAAALAQAGAACDAAARYATLLSLESDAAVVEAQATAQAACLPTPGPEATADPALTPDAVESPTAQP